MLKYNTAEVTPNVVTAGTVILISISVDSRDFTFDELDAKNITFAELDRLNLNWPEFEEGNWDG